MPAESKKQQRFFGMVHAVQKGDLSPSEVGPAVRKAAKNTDYSDAKDFASTKHKNLPEKKGSLQMKFFEKNAKVVRYNKDGTKTILYDDMERGYKKAVEEKKKKSMQKKAYDVKKMSIKELKESLEESPTKPMIGGAAAGGIYGVLKSKPKIRYSMLGGAAAFGSADAIQRYLSYQELEKRKK